MSVLLRAPRARAHLLRAANNGKAGIGLAGVEVYDDLAAAATVLIGEQGLE